MNACPMPGCQSTAGCICDRVSRGAAPAEAVVTDEMVTAAMRAFEQFAARLLRYPESERWHMNDVQGMRHAIKAALTVAASR